MRMESGFLQMPIDRPEVQASLSGLFGTGEELLRCIGHLHRLTYRICGDGRQMHVLVHMFQGEMHITEIP